MQLTTTTRCTFSPHLLFFLLVEEDHWRRILVTPASFWLLFSSSFVVVVLAKGVFKVVSSFYNSMEKAL